MIAKLTFRIVRVNGQRRFHDRPLHRTGSDQNTAYNQSMAYGWHDSKVGYPAIALHATKRQNLKEMLSLCRASLRHSGQ